MGRSPSASVNRDSTSIARTAGTAGTMPKPLAVGRFPVSTAGSAGSSICTTMPGARHPFGDVRDVRGQAPRPSEVARSSTAPESVSARCPDGTSSIAASVHGPHTCTLTHSAPAILLLRGVGVPGQEVLGTAGVPARTTGDPPAGWHHLAVDVDQHADGAPDHVGADPAVGQLDQVRQCRQFAGHDGRRLARPMSRARNRRRLPRVRFQARLTGNSLGQRCALAALGHFEPGADLSVIRRPGRWCRRR